jgi:serine/threonine protein phosphatase PrpC
VNQVFYNNLEIIEFTLNSDCKYIVIASDGVWEFLNNNAIMDIVNPYYKVNDPKGACGRIVQMATQWWEKVLLSYFRRIVLLMI